jgi:predicted metal-dependent enzyme (double-stranded beta helix superfamily)
LDECAAGVQARAMITQTQEVDARVVLSELVVELRHAVGRAHDWEDAAASTAAVLQESAVSADLLTPTERRATADGASGHRLHVEPDGSFSLIAIVWSPGQWTRIHDHITWCVFAGLQGEVTEQLYELDEPSATLIRAGDRTCTPGTVRCELPPGDIHRLGNSASDTAITVHVYGTDVDRLGTSARRIYDLPTTGLERAR